MQMLIDGAKISVHTSGRGEPVVLLHGFPFNANLWRAQIEALEKTNFVIAPDLRGMGKSEVTSGPYLMEALAGDVAAMLDELRVDAARVVGHSLGGYVALAFARMFTERVKRLALVTSRVYADAPETLKNREILAMRVQSEGIGPLWESYADTLFAAMTGADVRARAREMAFATNPLGAAAMMRGMAQRVDSSDLLPELRMPVLVLAGAHDTIAPVPEARAVVDALEDAELVVFERSAHLPMLEEPERCSELLTAFAG